MQTSLLRALRFLRRFQHERVLSQPAVKLDTGPAMLSPAFDRWPRGFVFYALLRQKVGARDLPAAAGTVLASNGSAKIAAVARRLGEVAGITPEIVIHRRDRWWPLAAILNRRLLRSVGRRRSLAGLLRSLDRVSAGEHRHVVLNIVALVVTYGNLRALLARAAPAMALTVCDLSARRIALGAAAAASGVAVVYAQQAAANGYAPPFRAAAAIVQDRAAAAALGAQGALLWQETNGDKLQQLRPVAAEPRTIGIAPNNYVDPSQMRARLVELTAAFHGAHFLLRLHPNSRLELGDLPARVSIDARGRSLDDFAGEIDLALVGSSTITLDLLERGVPALHLAGLDLMDFDTFGMVGRLIVPGASEIEAVDIGEINRFYGQPGWLERARARLGLITSDMIPAGERQAFVSWARQRLARTPASTGATTALRTQRAATG